MLEAQLTGLIPDAKARAPRTSPTPPHSDQTFASVSRRASRTDFDKTGRLRAGQDSSRAVMRHFPDGSDRGASVSDPSQRDSNQAIAEAVAAALKNQPQDRIVRILEIGAGTGGLAAHVLPRLRPARTDYVFSDKDENLVAKAEQKFFDYPFVRYQRLDVEKDLAGQNFDGQTFDLIIACDTVCFTSEVRKAVGQIRSLVAPGGLLVLAERVRIPAWFGFVFGLRKAGESLRF
jgi:SAM-dependent methyltransferase